MKHKEFHTHLLPEDRHAIEQGLYDGMSFKEIADVIHKDPTTVSKEIRRNINPIEATHKCALYHSCSIRHICRDYSYFCSYCRRCSEGRDCTEICSQFLNSVCHKLTKPPYVCNGCRDRNLISCTREMRRYYNAAKAQKTYEERLVKVRSGINMTIGELRALDELVSPLLKQGQPISHIYANHKDEIGVSRKTLYNYVDLGALTIKNIDLRRRVKYKKRKKQKNAKPIEYNYRKGRTYKDFLNWLRDHPDSDVIEMDTVKGSNTSGHCLLTMLFRSSSLMLIFLLNTCTQAEVIRIFDWLTETLGTKLFRRTFPVIITDNGPEFKDPERLEHTETGMKRVNVFFCDPSNSNQKARLEKNHEYIRYIIPKGKSMYRMTAEKALLMCNHINSISRDSLNGHTPYELAKLLINEEVLTKLGLDTVPPDEINLTSALLK